MKKNIKILTLNIGNPSLTRAELLIEWLKKREEDIFILTETKNSEGCKRIADFFSKGENSLFETFAARNVFFPIPKDNNYGVMCISKYRITPNLLTVFEDSILNTRAIDLEIYAENKKIHLIGLYVPSRDQSEVKIKKKKYFLEKISEELGKRNNQCCIICGDFNIVDRKHFPKYNVFFDWEYGFYDTLIDFKYIDAFKFCNPNEYDYSWVGRTNNGYRYDYFFVSEDEINNIDLCFFIHETRLLKISDHSAIVLKMKL